MKRWIPVIAVLFCLASVNAAAEQPGVSVLKMDREVVEDIFFQGNDIYVKVHEAYWEATFTVKISNENKADYRTWFSGEEEMAVKVYRSQSENLQGYTYRVNTAAKFIEYWMDGNLVLHLERII